VKLLVHAVVYKKTTSRRLLALKIRVGGHMGDLFLEFLIAHLQYLKNLVVILALRFQGVDICFDGGQGFGGRFSGRNQVSVERMF
jgi:hypothetical protein